MGSLGNYTGNNLRRVFGDPAFATITEATLGEDLVIGQWINWPDGGNDVFIGDVTNPTKAYIGVTIPNLFHPELGESGLTGEKANVVFHGEILLSGLSPGQLYYADPTTPGGMTKTRPDGLYQVLGVAITEERFFVNISGFGGGDDALLYFNSDAEAIAAGHRVYKTGKQHESTAYGIKKEVLPELI